MKPNRGLVKVAVILTAVILAFAATSLSGLAASQFEGTWKTKDTQGNPMEITLSGDGTATGKSGKAMSGTWKEEGGDAALISWSTGWTTKIAKDGDGYKKTAYKNGEAKGESKAEKVK